MCDGIVRSKLPIFDKTKKQTRTRLPFDQHGFVKVKVEEKKPLMVKEKDADKERKKAVTVAVICTFFATFTLFFILGTILGVLCCNRCRMPKKKSANQT